METTHEQILAELDETRSRLVTVLSGFKPEQLDITPFEGSWTAAQLAEHILKSLKGVLKTLHGPVKETNREPGAKVIGIKQVMLDSGNKFVAPEFLGPSNTPLNQELLLNSLDTKMKQIADAVKELSLTETCIAYELPRAGILTRLEWIYFVIYHTQRHTKQLENIHRQLAAL